MGGKLFRHGDVIIEEISEIPADAKETQNRVLAEGEVTGHKHVLRGQAVQVFLEGANRFLNVTGETVLVHEEHKEIRLPRGKYSVTIQREYNPVAERKVQD